MAIEAKRGCGYRKVGGLYLVGTGLGLVCGRLPYHIEICPVCGEGIRIGRGYRLIDGTKFFQHNCEKQCDCHQYGCAICNSDELGKCLVMSVGKKFYTPESFIKEAESMGVSKRIAHLPKGFKLGEMWVLLTHPEAGIKTIAVDRFKTDQEKVPAIFYAFKPKKVEKLMKESEATDKVVEENAKKGITIIKVPDNDTDHQGSVYKDKKKEEKNAKLV